MLVVAIWQVRQRCKRDTAKRGKTNLLLFFESHDTHLVFGQELLEMFSDTLFIITLVCAKYSTAYYSALRAARLRLARETFEIAF